MVPPDKIIRIAIEQNVDIIGLSGLITPSLDEMVHMAKEMQRHGMKIPLLIGGATTSRIHTAVKIDPQYDGPVVHVLDASRSVPVVSNLLGKDTKEDFFLKTKLEYAKMREDYAGKQKEKNFIKIEEARVKKFKTDWTTINPTKPSFLGNKTFNNYPLEEIAKYIDWTPFFQTWELHGKYPKILTDEVVGAEATKLYSDAQKMLKQIIDRKMIQANAVVGFYPANAVNDDDIELDLSVLQGGVIDSDVENKKASNKWLPEAFSVLSTTKQIPGADLFDVYDNQTNTKFDTDIQKPTENSKLNIATSSIKGTGSILDFSKEERLIYIENCLKNDEYYDESSGTFEQLSEFTNSFIEKYFLINYSNPYLSGFNDEIAFEPDEKSIEREGYLVSQIKYALHFVTGDTANETRTLDKSKVEKNDLIVDTLQFADEKYLQSKNNSIIYVKKLNQKTHGVMAMRIEVDKNGILRPVAFMPDYKLSRIEKRKASKEWSLEASRQLSTTKPLPGGDLFGDFDKQIISKSNANIQISPESSKSIIVDSGAKGLMLHHLRQQTKRAENVPYMCLTDFVAPKESGKQDYIGGFAVCTGIGMEKHIEKYEKEHDDYNSIMLKALADRFAEAFAELMHEKVRRELWGYAKDEKISTEQLIEEEYHGIRPAPGYPACPDHTEKATLFQLLEVEKNTGMILTDSFAMYPASAVSGWYFSHPQSKYFGLGKIDKDQVIDYALRKEMDIETCERWLSPALGY